MLTDYDALAQTVRHKMTSGTILALVFVLPSVTFGSDPPRRADEAASRDKPSSWAVRSESSPRNAARQRSGRTVGTSSPDSEGRTLLRIDPEKYLSRELPPESDDEHVRTIRDGTSSQSARRAAAAAMPLDKLASEDRRTVRAILRRVSLFRSLPTLFFHVNPEVYRYFLSRPEAAVSIWRAMEVSKVRIEQTGAATYRTADGKGTSGEIRIVYRDDEEIVALCEGVYQNSLLVQPIRARAVLHLQAGFAETEDGTPYVAHRACLYVAFPSQAVDAAARLFAPVSNLILDRNFQEVSLFAHMMTIAMARQPGWVEYIVHRMDEVPASCKQELLDLTAQVYVAAYRRELADRGPLSGPALRPLLPPVHESAPETAWAAPPPRSSENAGDRKAPSPLRRPVSASQGASERR